ncbi:MAG: hypothetical protein Kow00108_18770 [Calditrichia bacterium]
MQPYTFSKTDIETIASILECEIVERADCTRFILINEEDHRKLTFEIYPDIELGEEKTNLITVYTGNSHIQLHHVHGYVPSESLGEILFISASAQAVSGLVIAKEASCNMYAHVDRSVISADFTKLAPEVMVSGIALSIAEPLIQNLPDEK